MIRFPSSNAEIVLFFLVSIYLFNVLQYVRFWVRFIDFHNKKIKELIQNPPMSPWDFFDNFLMFFCFLFMLGGLIESLVHGISKTIFFRSIFTYIFFIYSFLYLKINEFLIGDKEFLTKLSYNFLTITALSLALIALSIIQLKSI